MKVGIIGGYGFLGYNLSNLLKRENNKVIIGDVVHPVENDGFEFKPVDLTNTESIKSYIQYDNYDVIVLTAAITDVDHCEKFKDQAFQVNCRGPQEVANLCQKHGIKLVFLSTDFVFDGRKGNYSEGEQPNPINIYGKSKLEGEKRIINALPGAIICRTSVLYGTREPFQHANFAEWVIEQLGKGEKTTITADQYNSPTHVNNLAEMINDLIKHDKKGIWHAAGKDCVNRYQFASQIAEILNLDSNLIEKIESFEQVASRPKKACLNVDKITNGIPTNPRGIKEGIAIIKKNLHLQKNSN